jgi:predicted MFS family arabinose efflux permease
LVDRLPKRSAISISHFARALVLGLLVVLIATQALSVSLLCVAAFVYGTGEAVADPASHALLPQLVHKQDLGRANSHLQLGQIVGEAFVGRALGGILFAVTQALPIVANTFLLVLAGALILGTGRRDEERENPSGDARLRGFWADLREGIVVVLGSRLLLSMALLVAVWAGVSGAFWGVAVIYALEVLTTDSAGYGILLALSAVGSLLGAWSAIRVVKRLGAFAAASVALVSSAAALIALAVARDVWVAATLLAVNGFAVTVWNVISVTVRQATVEPYLLGRVSSSYRVMATLALPVGAGLAGVLASHLGAASVFGASGILLLLAGALLLPLLARPFRRRWPQGLAGPRSESEAKA